MSPDKMILPAFLAIGCIGLAVSVSSSSEEPLAPVEGVVKGAPAFIDRFGALERSRWSVSNGWKNGNYSINDWRSSQVKLSDGLNLTLEPNQTDIAAYSSGEVQSIAVYGHGYFETRMRAGRGSGQVTGFFTYIGPHFKKPWHEIDIEILGAKPDRIQMTYFTDGKSVKKTQPLGFDATKSFHIYGFDWQDDAIRWYVDGKMVHEAKGDALPLPSEPQKIMMELWGSKTLTSWLGPFDASALPSTATVTCVAYSASYRERKPCS